MFRLLICCRAKQVQQPYLLRKIHPHADATKKKQKICPSGVKPSDCGFFGIRKIYLGLRFHGDSSSTPKQVGVTQSEDFDTRLHRIMSNIFSGIKKSTADTFTPAVQHLVIYYRFSSKRSFNCSGICVITCRASPVET